MKILLLGKNGQVGWELQRSLAPLGEVIALDSRSQGLCGDLSQLQALAATVHSVKPNIIVNAAAHTAVDKAESEPEKAHLLNALAPQVLADVAQQLGAWLVHYSTDYVFNGSGDRPWQEDDATAPLSIYGESKRAGEEAIIASGCRHLLFRTSWVYAARGHNFIKTMLRLAQQRDTLQVIDDQIGAPTGAELIADVTAHAIRVALQQPAVSGLYHLVASGTTHWHGYAQFVIESARAAGLPISVTSHAIHAVATSAFPTAATRPHNSRLATHKLQHTFDLTLPEWQTGVSRVLSELMESSA
jgi:dTDP-4-dehydrorhamnose reductase